MEAGDVLQLIWLDVRLVVSSPVGEACTVSVSVIVHDVPKQTGNLGGGMARLISLSSQIHFSLCVIPTRHASEELKGANLKTIFLLSLKTP